MVAVMETDVVVVAEEGTVVVVVAAEEAVKLVPVIGHAQIAKTTASLVVTHATVAALQSLVEVEAGEVDIIEEIAAAVHGGIEMSTEVVVEAAIEIGMIEMIEEAVAETMIAAAAAAAAAAAVTVETGNGIENKKNIKILLTTFLDLCSFELSITSGYYYLSITLN